MTGHASVDNFVDIDVTTEQKAVPRGTIGRAPDS